MSERPNFLDYSKTIGIWLVILGHFVYHFQLPYESSPIWRLCHTITLFHMPLFFIISGMLMKESSIATVLYKVLNRLIIPYMLVCGICFIAGLGIYYLDDYSIDFSFLKTQLMGILSATDLNGKGRDYFSSAMWFCIALAWIQLYFTFSNKAGKLCAMLGGVFLMFAGNVLPFRLDSALVGFIFFVIGFYGKSLFFYLADLKPLGQLQFFILALLVLIVSAMFNLDYGSRQCLSINAMAFGDYPPLFIISGISGTIAVMIISSWLSKIKFGKQLILTISNGTIVVLGFHKMIALLLQNVITTYTVTMALVYSTINLIFCYFLILSFKKYFPIILGGR